MSGAELGELEQLRAIVRAAAQTFESGELDSDTPEGILQGALLCAKSDFSVLGDANDSGGGIHSMVFRRAELRIDLALSLAEYCEAHGWPDAPEAENGGAQ